MARALGARHPEYYFHPGIVDWINRAETLAVHHPLAEVSGMVRQNLEDEILKLLDGRPIPWSDGIGHAWDFVLDGSFSLCLVELNADNLVRKEVARQRFKELLTEESKSGSTEKLRKQMSETVEDFEHVTLPFSPHEFDESSRRLELEPAMAKFGLHNTLKTAE